MKTTVNLFFLSFLSMSVFFSCNEKAVETKILAENKAKVTMNIEGMVCAVGCAKKIEEEVAKMNGIAKSEVNFEEATANFEFDQSVMTPKEIEDFIDEMQGGQYQAKIISEEKPQKINSDQEEKGSPEKDASIKSIKQNFNFTFPELFTYFLDRI